MLYPVEFIVSLFCVHFFSLKYSKNSYLYCSISTDLLYLLTFSRYKGGKDGINTQSVDLSCEVWFNRAFSVDSIWIFLNLTPGHKTMWSHHEFMDTPTPLKNRGYRSAFVSWTLSVARLYFTQPFVKNLTVTCGSFSSLLRMTLPIKLISTILIKYCRSGIKHQCSFNLILHLFLLKKYINVLNCPPYNIKYVLWICDIKS